MCVCVCVYVCVFPASCLRQRTCLAQGLIHRVFNETLTYSCLKFEWFVLPYIFLMNTGPFSESVFLLAYFLPHLPLIFDILCGCGYGSGFRFHL